MSASYTATGGQADNTSSGLTTITFGSLTFTAGFNIAAFAASSGAPVTSMTINGVSATFLGSSGGDGAAIELWGATVGSGTGSVVVNITSNSFGSCLVYGVLSGANNTPSGSPAVLASTTTFSGAQGPTTGLTLAAGDLGLVAVSLQSGTGGTVTFSNATFDFLQTTTRPQNIAIAHMTASGTPLVTNQLGNVGSIVALKFTASGGLLQGSQQLLFI